MVESTSTNDGSTSDGTDGSSSGMMDFVTTPLGMGLLGGIVIAIAAGYYIL